MREHIRILGILNIIMGSLTALVGIFVLALAGGVAGAIAAAINGSDASNGAIPASIIASIGVAIAIFFLLLGLPSILGGWGLLKFRPWARVLMIVVSAFHLLHIPLGTILGVYGFWVLFSDEGRRLLESGGAAQPLPRAGYPSVGYPTQSIYPASGAPNPQPPNLPPQRPPAT